MKELARYEKHLIRALDCPPDLRKRLVNSTRAMAQDFLAGKPDADWSEVEAFLGDPRELACTMLESEDQEALVRYRARRSLLKRCAVGALAVAFLVTLVTMIYIYRERSNPVFVTETTIIHGTEEIP